MLCVCGRVWGVVYRGDPVSLGGVAFRTHVMDFDSSAVDGLVGMRETGVKYLMGPVVSGLFGVDPRLLSLEVGLPTEFVEVAAGSAGELAGLRRNDRCVRIYEGEGPSFTVRGVLFERLVDLNDPHVDSVVGACLG